jgi:hypothetical protein
MFNLTNKEIAEAVTRVLELLGVSIQTAQGYTEDERRTVGMLVIEFKEDGDYSCNQAGVLNKALVLGALVDSLISYRELSNVRQAGEMFEAMAEAATIQDDNLN